MSRYNSFKVIMTVALFLLYTYQVIYTNINTVALGITAGMLTITLNYAFFIRHKETPKNLIDKE